MNFQTARVMPEMLPPLLAARIQCCKLTPAQEDHLLRQAAAALDPNRNNAKSMSRWCSEGNSGAVPTAPITSMRRLTPGYLCENRSMIVGRTAAATDGQ